MSDRRGRIQARRVTDAANQHSIGSESDDEQARSSGAPTSGSRRWWAFAVLLIAGFMDLVDVTIVNVALPSIQRDLQAPYVDLEWIVSAYVLGFAALLITGGRLGDLVGRRRILLTGLAGFTAASLVCGTASNSAVLIGSRFVQGAMAGLMVPQILSIVHVTFRNDQRAKALGIWGAVMGAASVAGVLLGGVLVEWNVFDLAWRPIFLVNVPIGVLAIAAAPYLVAESRSATATRLDPTGMTLALAAVLLLVYPLIEGRSLGWPIWAYLLMVSSLVVTMIFVGYERRRTRTVGSPLVVLALFRVRAFSVGMLVWGLFWIASGGFFLAWTLYLQAGLGWTPLHAGLTAAIFAVAAAAGSGVSVQVFVPRFGRAVLMAGALINAAGFGGYLWAAAHYGPAITSMQMALPLLATGFGFGLVVAPMVDLILTDVPTPDAGSASGLLFTAQQVGMALGVALVGVVFVGQLAHNAGNAVDAVVPSLRQQLSAIGQPPPAQDGIVAGFRACVKDRSAAPDPTAIPPSCRTAASAPAPVANQLRPILTAAGLQANARNFAYSFAYTLGYGVAILTAVFAGIFALPNRVAQPLIGLESLGTTTAN